MLAHQSSYSPTFSYLLTIWLSASSAAAQEIHFSPEGKLDTIDSELIGSAKRSIDVASYTLTDRVVLNALNAASRRGVVIRIVLDPREPQDFMQLEDLSDNVRIKRSGPLMHLKAYEVDGELLRTGSANFSASGERRQDNDLIVIGDPSAAAKFDGHLERMWVVAQPMIECKRAIENLEPRVSAFSFMDEICRETLGLSRLVEAPLQGGLGG